MACCFDSNGGVQAHSLEALKNLTYRSFTIYCLAEGAIEVPFSNHLLTKGLWPQVLELVQPRALCRAGAGLLCGGRLPQQHLSGFRCLGIWAQGLQVCKLGAPVELAQVTLQGFRGVELRALGVQVRNLGAPVELAQRYFAEGADEVTFLNITGFRDFPLSDLPMLEARAYLFPFVLSLAAGACNGRWQRQRGVRVRYCMCYSACRRLTQSLCMLCACKQALPAETLPHLCAQVLRRASEGVFVPLTVGGGIRGFTDADGVHHSALDVAAEYFRSGADKVLSSRYTEILGH